MEISRTVCSQAFYLTNQVQLINFAALTMAIKLNEAGLIQEALESVPVKDGIIFIQLL